MSECDLFRVGSPDEMTPDLPQNQLQSQMTTVIPNVDSLIGDLLDMNPPLAQQPLPSMMTPSMGPGGPAGQSSSAMMDLLGDGLDTFVCKLLSCVFTYITVYSTHGFKAIGLICPYMLCHRLKSVICHSTH